MREWNRWNSHDCEGVDDHDENTVESEEAYVQFIGKGSKNGTGKGFQGCCFFFSGEFGHSQWDCGKGKSKGRGWSKREGVYGKGCGRDGYNGKGYGKDGHNGKGE